MTPSGNSPGKTLLNALRDAGIKLQGIKEHVNYNALTVEQRGQLEAAAEAFIKAMAASGGVTTADETDGGDDPGGGDGNEGPG